MTLKKPLWSPTRFIKESGTHKIRNLFIFWSSWVQIYRCFGSLEASLFLVTENINENNNLEGTEGRQHILVDAQLSVSEGHQISEAVEHELTSRFDEINDVTVHIDPEDDQYTPNSCRNLPLRNEVMQRLQTCWAEIPQAGLITKTGLHYIEGKVNVEVVIPLSLFDSITTANKLRDQLHTATLRCDVIGRVDVYFS